MIVPDTNILVAALVEGDRTEEARRLLQLEPDLRLPPLWRDEFCNVLVTMSRHGRMSADHALLAMDHALERFGPFELRIDHTRALAVGIDRGLSGYDASFLALALQVGAALVTEDAAFRRKAGPKAFSLAEYLARLDGYAVSDATPAPYPQKAPPRRRTRS